MNANDVFGQELSTWLRKEGEHRVPDHLREVLVHTAATRQRPWWSSPERWLSVQTTLRFAPMPRIAWLLVVLALILALAATAVLVVGSRPRMPPPFGPAANGLIAYGAADGDLYAIDAVSGTSHPLVTGGEHDETPDFAPNGTQFVFAREKTSGLAWLLMVANADGTNVRPLTGPVDPQFNVWSPDSKRVAVVDTLPAVDRLTIYSVDGKAPVDLPVDMAVGTIGWLSDSQLFFFGHEGATYGLYVVGTDGSAPRPILPVSAVDADWMNPVASPDGSRIAYSKWGDQPMIHVVDIATGSDRKVQYDGANLGDGWPSAWSPDGTKLVFSRWTGTENRLAIGSVDGGPAVEIGPGFPDGTNGAIALFSPDGRRLIARYGQDTGTTWLLDAAGGPGKRLVTAPYLATWQRQAP